MPEVRLKIRDLVLDHDNPRITHAAGQREALQKIVNDQKTKLVRLAQSIATYGLSPADRLLVLRTNRTPRSYIALEGNRRVAVFMMVTRPAVMTGLDMPGPMKRIFERLAKSFKKGLVEPIAAFELASRDDARYWLNLRHNVGHEDRPRGWHRAYKDCFRYASAAAVSRDIASRLSASSRVADVDRVLQIQMRNECCNVGSIGVHVIPRRRRTRSTVASTIVGNDAKAFLEQEQQLVIPLVCRERPPMVKNDRLPSTPIFEKDFGPIVCFDFTHVRSPIAVKLAQHCLWCSRPMARCARRSRRSSGLTNRGSTVRLKTAQSGGSWVSPCRPSPASLTVSQVP
jgi:hypothetical protein